MTTQKIPNIPLGTFVTVTVPARHFTAINQTIPQHTITGHVTFIGFNKAFGHKQVTVNRTPVTLTDFDQVTVTPKPKGLFD